MTAYTQIPNGQIDTDSPVTQSLMTALRDNLAATAEGSAQAPVVTAAWHPYDMVNVGDGADGEIYNFSADGSVAAVSTPAFIDGFEYMLKFEQIEHSTGGGATLIVQGVHDGTTRTIAEAAGVNSTPLSGFIHYRLPRVPSRALTVSYSLAQPNAQFSATVSQNFAVFAPVSSGRVSFSPGNIVAGTIRMYRRREYVSG